MAEHHRRMRELMDKLETVQSLRLRDEAAHEIKTRELQKVDRGFTR